MLELLCLFSHNRFHFIFDSKELLTEISVDLCVKINSIREICIIQKLSFKYLTVQLRATKHSSFWALLQDLDYLGTSFQFAGGLKGSFTGTSGCTAAAGKRIAVGGCDF